MKIPQSYALIEATRSGLNVATLGLGTVKQITPQNSLYTVVTVEGFSASLGLIVLAHELYQFYKDVDRNSDKSLYLFLRMCSIFAGIIGLSFIAADLPSENLGSAKITAGTSLIALGIFSSRILTNSINQKNSTIDPKRHTML